MTTQNQLDNRRLLARVEGRLYGLARWAGVQSEYRRWLRGMTLAQGRRRTK